jgi:hypothetical protein
VAFSIATDETSSSRYFAQLDFRLVNFLNVRDFAKVWFRAEEPLRGNQVASNTSGSAERI